MKHLLLVLFCICITTIGKSQEIELDAINKTINETYYLALSNPIEANKTAYKMLHLCLKINNMLGIAESYQILGAISYFKGDNKKSIPFTEESIDCR